MHCHSIGRWVEWLLGLGQPFFSLEIPLSPALRNTMVFFFNIKNKNKKVRPRRFGAVHLVCDESRFLIV